MKTLKSLFDNNKKWADDLRRQDPEFFKELAQQQNPEYLWIGCSDSRVPANQIVDLPPGAVFVHRNIANLVVHTDVNCLSVLQYAVDVLRVKHIIVCGHYGCGGIKAAMENTAHGLIDNWLRHVQDICRNHRAELDAIADADARRDRVCELNVIEQVRNVCMTTPVQAAWESKRNLCVHGWIYRLSDGILQDLNVTVSSFSEFQKFLQK